MENVKAYNLPDSTVLSAHQPAYLPWLGYFHKIALSDVFVILDSVQFEKNSFINRNKIKTAQGVAIWLTVPVLTKGHSNKTIRDMEINNATNWREKHWKSIYLSYKKAPYFEKYSAFFETLYKKEWLKLCDLLECTMNFFIKELKIPAKFYKQSDLKIHTRKQELILDMCRHFNSAIYISGALGKDYIDVPLFEKHNIRVLFQDYNHPCYPQLGEGFMSHLSIIDLLFNVDKPEILDVIMEKNVEKEYLERIVK